MIFKSDLIEAINSLGHDLTSLAIRVSDLERRVAETKTPKQPRDKSGKFAKKK